MKLKFIFLLTITLLINQILTEQVEKLENTKSSLSLKECEGLYSKILCEKMQKAELGAKTKTKTKYRVEAVFYSNENYKSTENAGSRKSDLFNLAMPINTCKSQDCVYCCLST